MKSLLETENPPPQHHRRSLRLGGNDRTRVFSRSKPLLCPQPFCLQVLWDLCLTWGSEEQTQTRSSPRLNDRFPHSHAAGAGSRDAARFDCLHF